MRPNEKPVQRAPSRQSEFEEYLKNSNHFVGTINAHRQATTEVIAAFALLLVEHNKIPEEVVCDLLKGLEAGTSSGAAVDSARRFITSGAIQAIKGRARR